MEKYSEKVTAIFHRFIDEKGNCYLVRNNTRIWFGEGKVEHLVGTVIMTNPGSYGFKDRFDWNDFENGKGTKDILEDRWAKPDPTMRIIIDVIKDALTIVNKDIPNGYVEIYNLSSIVCPNGKKAQHNHTQAYTLMGNQNEHLLMDPIIYDEQKLQTLIEKSPFIILGFLQEKFKNEMETLLKRIGYDYTSKSEKIIAVEEKMGIPAHPRRWRLRKNDLKLEEKIVDQLINIL